MATGEAAGDALRLAEMQGLVGPLLLAKEALQNSTHQTLRTRRARRARRARPVHLAEMQSRGLCQPGCDRPQLELRRCRQAGLRQSSKEDRARRRAGDRKRGAERAPGGGAGGRYGNRITLLKTNSQRTRGERSCAPDAHPVQKQPRGGRGRTKVWRGWDRDSAQKSRETEAVLENVPLGGFTALSKRPWCLGDKTGASGLDCSRLPPGREFVKTLWTAAAIAHSREGPKPALTPSWERCV